MSDVISNILSPIFEEPPPAPPAPEVSFKVGDSVRIFRFGWSGGGRVEEIRGEFVRLEGVMRMFEQDRSCWFHYADLRASPK